MFNQLSLAQGELHLYQKVQVSTDTSECLDLCVCVCVWLPELGLESLSTWTLPLGSGVGGESRSEGMSHDKVDQRE